MIDKSNHIQVLRQELSKFGVSVVSLQPGDYSKVSFLLSIFFEIKLKNAKLWFRAGHPPPWLSPCKHERHVGRDEWASQVSSSSVSFLSIAILLIDRAEYKQFFLAYHARLEDMRIQTTVHNIITWWYQMNIENGFLSPNNDITQSSNNNNNNQGFPIRLHWPSLETPLGSSRWCETLDDF